MARTWSLESIVQDNEDDLCSILVVLYLAVFHTASPTVES